jgi:uncharacterized repeat protein (TIGR01451 family)
MTKTSVTCSGTPGACSGTITVASLQSGYALPTIGIGKFYEILVVANITATSGNLTNIATVAVPGGTTDPTPANNSAADVDSVLSIVANLGITKSDGVGSVNAGGTTTYTIVVTNAGPSSANNAIFKDALVTGLNVTSVTCGSATGGAACPAAGSVTVPLMQGSGIVITTMPNGGSVTFSVTGTVTKTSGTITNTATITAPSGTTDPTSANDSASDTDNINLITDLAITKTDGITSVIAGGSTTYTIVVTNNGPSPADGAIFKDGIITGLTVTAVSCGSAAGGAACPAAGDTTITLMQGTGIIIPTLPSGGSVTFSVTGTATGAASPIANVATITAPAGATDPTPGNNTATDPADTVGPSANLAITKDDGVTTIGSGATTTYNIVVTNLGPSPANNSVFKDAALTGLSVTGVTCNSPTGSAACPTAVNTTVALMQGTGIVIPTLPSGGSVTFSVTATVTATSGSIANVATITPPSGVTDPVAGNNSATDPADTVSLLADLLITKTDSRSSIPTGRAVTYTIVVANNGPSVATNAIFQDPAIAALTVSTVTCGSALGGASCPTAGNTTKALMQGTGIIIPTLPAGGSVTFTVTGTAAAGSGPMANVATVTAPSGTTDPSTGNNSVTDTDTIIGVCSTGVTTLEMGSLTYGDGGNDKVSWLITNHYASALPILSVEVSWAGAGTGSSNFQLDGITLTNSSTLSTSLPASSSPYTSGTGSLKTSATKFTFDFSKNNPTSVGVILTVQLPDTTICNLIKP